MRRAESAERIHRGDSAERGCAEGPARRGLMKKPLAEGHMPPDPNPVAPGPVSPSTGAARATAAPGDQLRGNTACALVQGRKTSQRRQEDGTGVADLPTSRGAQTPNFTSDGADY
ncbi:unnamed protein product [Lampetra planeri]